MRMQSETGIALLRRFSCFSFWSDSFSCLYRRYTRTRQHTASVDYVYTCAFVLFNIITCYFHRCSVSFRWLPIYISRIVQSVQLSSWLVSCVCNSLVTRSLFFTLLWPRLIVLYFLIYLKRIVYNITYFKFETK